MDAGLEGELLLRKVLRLTQDDRLRLEQIFENRLRNRISRALLEPDGLHLGTGIFLLSVSKGSR
jgi:hypothetical protein